MRMARSDQKDGSHQTPGTLRSLNGMNSSPALASISSSPLSGVRRSLTLLHEQSQRIEERNYNATLGVDRQQ